MARFVVIIGSTTPFYGVKKQSVYRTYSKQQMVRNSGYCFWKRAGLTCFYDSEIVKFGLREISKCAESQGSFESETKQELEGAGIITTGRQ